MAVGGNTMKIAICDDDLVLNKKLHQFIFVKSYSKIEIILNGGQTIPLSRLRFKEFTAFFREFVKRTAR